MAIEVGFGGVAVTQSYTDRYVYSDGVPLPTGRTMASGSRACLITSVRGFAAGRGGARAMSISLGPRTSGAFTVGSAGSAQNTGWRDIDDWLVQGGTTRFTLNFTGSTYFGRDNVGSGIDSYGTNFGNLGGGYLYVQSPSEARISVGPSEINSGGFRTTVYAPGDDGGSSITGYRVQWARNSAFTVGFGEVDAGTGTTEYTGFDVGTRYYFRVAAKNAVTNAAGTFAPWSAVESDVAPGPPSAPRSLTATAVSGKLDTVKLDWTTPSDTAGGITGYEVWNGTSVYTSFKGTTTDITISGLQKNKHYSWYIKARNAYSDKTGKDSARSNIVEYDNWSSSSAVRNLTATAVDAVAGRITLTWQPPTDVGQGITRYAIYSSTGALISSVPGTQTTYNADGLTPGTYYAFYILAYTAVSDAANNADNKSNTAGTTAVGQPVAPTALKVTPSVIVPGRLTLTWTQPGSYTSFNVYEVTGGTTALIANVTTPKIVLDGQTPTAHTYVIAARNAATDSTTPATEGPRSTSASGTPGLTASIAVSSFTVPNVTNAGYNGSYVINTVAPKTMTYTLAQPDQGQTSVPAGVGGVVDATNAALSGVHTISSVTTTTFSFAQTSPDIPSNTAVPGVTALNTTNTVFNGTYTVSGVDNTNFKVSYANTGADFATASASGTVTNKSNTVYNGTNLVIVSTPSTNQFTYAKTNANIAETSASGTATNITNRDYYNATPDGRGSVVVLTAPTYNTLTYTTAAALTQVTTSIGTPYGKAYRATSRSSLSIKYRSGWAG